jgi:hypothetical protein
MENDFATIDAQDETSRFAQMTPEEQAEYNEWLDIFMSEVLRDIGP